LKKKKKYDTEKIKKKLLQPSWKGPQLVMLAALTAVEVTGVTPGTHHSWIKGQPPLQNPMSDRLSMTQLTQIKVPENVTTAFHHWRDLQPCPSHIPEPGWSMHGRSLRIHSPEHKCILFSVTHTVSC
jgi:hypothetical protein